MTESKYADQLRALGFEKKDPPKPDTKGYEIVEIVDQKTGEVVDHTEVSTKRYVAPEPPCYTAISLGLLSGVPGHGMTIAIDETRQFWVHPDRIIDLRDQIPEFKRLDDFQMLH